MLMYTDPVEMPVEATTTVRVPNRVSVPVPLARATTLTGYFNAAFLPNIMMPAARLLVI
jgi:hypothetical protein